MRYHAWLLFPVLLALLTTSACDKKSDTPPSDSPPPVATPTETSPPKPEPVADTDVEHLQEQFRCPSKEHKETCDILEGFSNGTKWDLTTIQAEEARYFGKAFVYQDGKREERWMFLLVKKMPLNRVAPADMPLRLALRELDKSREAENNHAERLLSLLQRDDAVHKRNMTAKYILSYTSNNWDSAAETAGASVIFHIGSGAYVRQGKQRSLLLVQVEAAKPGATSVDGMFLQLYPLSW